MFANLLQIFPICNISKLTPKDFVNFITFFVNFESEIVNFENPPPFLTAELQRIPER
jgi:hypothetical protein